MEQRFKISALGAPMGLYSHTAIARRSVYLAGMLGQGETLDSQCDYAFGRVYLMLLGMTLEWSDVVQFTIYLVDKADVEGFNHWRQSRFPTWFPSGDYPVSTLVIVSDLIGQGRRIEVQTVADGGEWP